MTPTYRHMLVNESLDGGVGRLFCLRCGRTISDIAANELLIPSPQHPPLPCCVRHLTWPSATFADADPITTVDWRL